MSTHAPGQEPGRGPGRPQSRPSLDVIRAELNAVLVAAPPDRSADELCVACVRLLGVDGAAISVVHEGASHGTFGSSSPASRRLDEYQFTFGEGPCLEAVAKRRPVLVPDLDLPDGQRWPAFTEAVLHDGIRSVFALPIMLASSCVGALDLVRAGPGPLEDDQLAGAALAAELASLTLLDLFAGPGPDVDADVAVHGEDGWGRLAELDRIEVYQATGMLIAQLEVGPAEALVRLRAHAMATNQTASQVAAAIVERRLVLERDAPEPPGARGRSRP
ncbi:GAF and ANTAR domain-containing protein [Nocardioides sp. 1609]|uniref:GAF and ANTAR domain-containing protein n=1 Tax=Nocardioides sp. 1609 TaxID=2508327 RepID=UPI001ADAEBE1|nr:GAF and ANTAR domain-containing protein [Nocardioides sp. 1609]